MENYKFLEKIGRGSHGTVYLLETTIKEKRFVVCKSILEKYRKYAIKEINLLSKISNKRIIKYIDSIKNNEHFFIILEYANHGSLENMINYFRKKEFPIQNSLIWSMLAQVTDALAYLHNRNIIHRDIKPSNILINQFYIGNDEILEFKICDFGLSAVLNEDLYSLDDSLVGTPYYMAPEILKRENYDCTVDIWSLGVCLYEMITLKKPFVGKTKKELQDSIINNEIIEIIECKDKELKIISLKCLSKTGRTTANIIKTHEKIKYSLALIELYQKERKIDILERKIKKLESNRISGPPTPG